MQPPNLLAFDYDGNFERDDQLILAVQDLNKEKAIEVLTQVLSADTRERATILLYAKEHELGKNIKSSFHDINQWKNTRKYQ